MRHEPGTPSAQPCWQSTQEFSEVKWTQEMGKVFQTISQALLVGTELQEPETGWSWSAGGGNPVDGRSDCCIQQYLLRYDRYYFNVT